MNIVITGISRGLGRELAIQSQLRGFNVVGTTHNLNNLNNIKDVTTFELDLTSPEQIASFHHKLGGWNHVDVLINNAAILEKKAIDAMNQKDFVDHFKLNAVAPFLMYRALYSMLKKADKPHVINISSQGGVVGTKKFPELTPYAMSKSALNNLTECLASFDSSISVNAFALGSMDTDMFKDAFPNAIPASNTIEMATLILNMATTANRVMSGKVVNISNSGV